MPDENKEAKNSERISRVETEIHIIGQTLLEQKEENKALFTKLFDKLETHIEKKPMSAGTIAGVIVSVLTAFALLMGGIIWTIGSMMQPLTIQQSQTTSILTVLNNSINDVSKNVDLTNKDVSGIKELTKNNQETLQWLLFDENLPKQVTTTNKDIEYLRRDVDTLMQKAHTK